MSVVDDRAQSAEDNKYTMNEVLGTMRTLFT